ncbi:MAG: class I SAM-dependent methyltransferase [Acidimicrobiales bacterium]
MGTHLPGLPGSGDPTAADNYSGRLLTGGSFLTRLSHRRRLRRSTRVLRDGHFGRAADVGAADGWYLRALLDAGVAERGVAVDADEAMLAVGASRSDGYALDFVLPDAEALLDQQGSFDLVACLETLEHVDDCRRIIALVADLCAPGGTIVVSVPIEVGPSLVLKQVGRWLANRRGQYSYESYTVRELARAALLWRTRGLSRGNLHSHKSFDFRTVRGLLQEHAHIERTTYSPWPPLGPVIASTVIWVATKP